MESVIFSCLLIFVFKQKTAYEMRISDWSSDVCSSDLVPRLGVTNCFKPPKDGWGSAKLRALNDLVPTEALALPWVLPSLTWWAPSGPWAKVTQSTKMLIFSRFRATPQSLEIGRASCRERVCKYV